MLRQSGALLTCLAAVLLAASSEKAGATVIVNAIEVGGDVVLTGSGSLNTAALSFDRDGLARGAINPGDFVTAGPLQAVEFFDAPRGFVGPFSFGPGRAEVFTFEGSGDTLGLNFSQGFLTFPDGYVSGDPLSGSSTFEGESFASLGMTPGTYTWSWGSGASADSFTLNVVPEPSTAIVLALGLAGLATSRPSRGA